MKVAIEKIEYYLPENKLDGNELLRDNPDWRIQDIEAKTGITRRYKAGIGESVIDMAEKAANKLFATNIDIDKASIDFLILVTQVSSYTLPTSACILQDRLGLKTSTMAFDVNLGCSGYVYALSIAAGLIESGQANRGVIICSDHYTSKIDPHDRTCRPIFSDAAAATIVGKSLIDGISAFDLGTNGSGYKNLIIPNDGDDIEGAKPGFLFMAGAAVFLFSMSMVPKCINNVLAKSGKNITDVDLFVFHQASKVVIDKITAKLNLPIEKVYTNYQHIGNTVSATIPIALKDAYEDGSLRAGDCSMLVGFGVGYSWGGCIIETPDLS
jgi:3-oxoacyl-[acyl-carrier-protein] synthase-3